MFKKVAVNNYWDWKINPVKQDDFWDILSATEKLFVIFWVQGR